VQLPPADQVVVQKKVVRAAEQDRADVRAKREAWAERVPGLDPAKLVFIDETGANTKMTRRYGRAPVGQRLVGVVPHGHWKTTTFVAALRSDGLVAPMVVDGAMNGDVFVAYARQVLVPALRPGDVVVMDNLQCHKRVAAVRAIEQAGCSVAYLPPYSPDLNPIELAFAKVKARLRAAELRTIDKVEDFFGAVHEAFDADECRRYIRHAGYAATH
jgi:transposase